ncbi:hypothetical protein B0H12DRAFT_462987 [Mycena haematopus]|nr:hypothetical protein B0H12DRAFT_462987 [Mycena haematopus]
MPEDDCIQYLGTRPAARALPSPPFLSSSQRPVTGVALYIEKSAAEPGHGMIFRKAEEPVVHIGRRPGSDGDKCKTEPGKAFFTCPVVSRHHAKIAFSDSGHCYIIDLHSHHGTHIRKKDEAVSKQLNAETPTLLADGDVVTFGKSVGSDKGLVRPVVARVDLLYGSQPPLKPLVVPGVPESEKKSFLRTLSGRYGVYAPASSGGSSSSDERASSDSHDSDIEEISAPAPKPPAVVRPPWHDDNSSSDLTSPQKQTSECFPTSRPYSPFGFSEGYRAFSPGPSEQVSPSFEPASSLFDRDSSFYNVGFDAYSNDIFEDDDDDDNSDHSYSRSNSSMDLSSSPEPSGPPAGANKEVAGEPIVVGAWPRSRSSSPVSVFSSSFPSVRIRAPVEEAAPLKPVSNDAAKVAVDSAENDSDVEVTSADKVDYEKSVDSLETTQLKASLATVKAEVAKLNAHRRRYKQRFNDNTHAMGDRFSDLEERATEAHDLYNLLSERLEENVDACHQAQAQLDALQARIDETPEKAVEPETTPYADEAKAKAKLLGELVTEMTMLRDNARKEMVDELQSIQEAKEALKSLTEQVQAQTASLKRKRLDEEAEGEAVQREAAKVLAFPPRKRARQVAKVLVKTATAVSIGAVMTWSALAFS